jgi:asparagine synthase (glutamine-hydrolysing)
MLAHRRLSILDLSDAASQPMVDDLTGDVIVLNGEIYNFKTLRDDLAKAGHSMKSTGDTAPMLRTLALEGSRGLGKLRGMFAFAFWDVDARQLLLARDPLGIKPLYFARNPKLKRQLDDGFCFGAAGDPGLRLVGEVQLNPVAVGSVAWNGFVVGPETIIQGVTALGAGESLVVDAEGREHGPKRYWSLPPRDSVGSVTEEEVAEALKESVALHLASDVPLGVFLSGGIDSSAVANLAHRVSGSEVHTFTLAFEEQEHNEGVFARQISQAIGTRHHEVMLSEGDFFDNLDTALDSLDQPTFDGLNSYFMSRAVKEAGFTVALVGSGGDELFGGYTSFRDLPVLARWARRARFVPMGLRRAIAAWFAAVAGRGGSSDFPPQTRWAKLPDMVGRGEDLVGLYQLAYALFLPDFHRRLLGGNLPDGLSDGLPLSVAQRIGDEIAGRSDLAAISILEQQLFLGERLLKDTDAVSMASSIEIRLPLVDQVLLEHVDRLPDEARYQPVRSKQFLRRWGLKGLDPALFDRPKSGV